MSSIDLYGIFPPVPTPFVHGKLACDRLASNLDKLSRTGLKGIVVLGSNGEYVYLSADEKKKVVQTAVESVPADMPVIAGTGCESTAETIRLTREVARLGARAALVVTPHYYSGLMSVDAMVQHFTAVADNVPIPVILYNVPKFTGVNLGVEVVARLALHPNIAGIKDSTGNVSQLGQYVNHAGGDFKVLVGTAGALLGALSLGCVGAVAALANVAAENCVDIYELVKKGDYDAAGTLQLKMLPVNQAVTITYGVPGLKSAMDMLGFFGGAPRLPLLPSTEKEKQEIRAILEKAELLYEEDL